jgi:ferrous iron transport protein B
VASEITVALAGNPNSGKTTLFNNLTGAHQHVGNWPGVTVEKREGFYNYHGYRVRVVDLPGVYSLTAHSPDEVVARNFILDENPNVVVDVVDGSNLERNLYLTVQLMELETRLVIVLNMMDVVRSRRYQINVARLSEELGVPVVPMVASRREGLEDLFAKITEVYEGREIIRPSRVYYGSELEQHITEMEQVLAHEEGLARQLPRRWLAIKLLENDPEVRQKIGIEN